MKLGATFYLNTQPVGCFSSDGVPTTDGEYKYMPYRGPGHYDLGVHLKTSRTPRCYYKEGTRRVEFSVAAHVGYGVLKLKDFEIVEGGA
jgi:hypothetical protein